MLFGWGAGDFYRGHANPWTLFTAIIGANQSVLHIVPVRGSLTARFPHSDIIQLDLPRPDVRILAAEIDRAFALDSHRERIAAGRGYYPESRFYAGRERFYFPKMCNVWVAQKLRRSGVPVTASAALIASDLVRQTEKLGHRLHSRRRPADAF